MDVVRERKENSEDKKGKADDGDGENVPNSVLPEIVGCFFQKIFDYLQN